ncbi:MAG: DUF2786 domain-containing protein [Actinomycetota bacterium]|nr:DUF2786 domain-containing protein [Actinomycetota bacterium]
MNARWTGLPGRSWTEGNCAEARALAEGHRVLMRVRSLLAVAESSAFAAEAAAFTDKAMRLAGAHGIGPELLRFPRESLDVVVIVAELHRLQAALQGYGAGGDDSWATRTAEWSSCLDDYDVVLEAAAEVLQLPIPRLPYGSRRHFRPEQRARIERLISQKVSSP